MKCWRLFLSERAGDEPAREEYCMDWFLPFVIIVIVSILLVFYRRVTVFDYESGLLYSQGKFQRILSPGTHGYWRGWQKVQKLDMRTRYITLPGQEVLTADNISLKVTLVASFKIGDPHQAVMEAVNFQEALYLLLQINLRDIVGGLNVDDLLVRRGEIGGDLFNRSLEQVKALGLVLVLVNIKDVMFPGDLKEIFARVVNARKEGLAALERARGESAALRNLANAAKLLHHNPELAQLRMFQVMENSGGSTVVWMPGAEAAGVQEAIKKTAKPEKK